jgi:hypothetical protein
LLTQLLKHDAADRVVAVSIVVIKFAGHGTLGRGMMSKFILLSVASLLESEGVESQRVSEIVRNILRQGLWTEPVCIDKDSRVVMDGHHRLAAARVLCLAFIPVSLFSYEDVRVSARIDGYEVSPVEILRRGLTRNPYPPKTTRHVFPARREKCSVSLDKLRAESGFEQRVSWVWNGKDVRPVQKAETRYAHTPPLIP